MKGLAETDPRIGEFRERCRQLGLIDTPRRRVLWLELLESSDHPTAETLHGRVQRRIPGVSLATVYRNLRTLVSKGLVDEVATGGSVARYDGNRDRHHHLVCTRCGNVADHYSESFDSVAPQDAMIDGFEIHDVRVNAFGICARCRAAQQYDDNEQEN